MATISKRIWTTSKGEQRIGWTLHYIDGDGTQQRNLFKLKRDAEEARIRIEADLSVGSHISDQKSITVIEAGIRFLADFQTLVDTKKRERSTLRGYQQHIDLHLKPFPIATVKLSQLKGPNCTEYARALETTRSDAMARRIFATFRRVLDFSVSNGWIASNVAKSVNVRTSGNRNDKSKIEIPTKSQLRSLIKAAEDWDTSGKCHAMICILLFAGLRASELRGLRWQDIDFSSARIQVEQRADRWQKIGPVKTKNSHRYIPIPAVTNSALRKWRLASTSSQDGLVFPTGNGRPESYANIYNRIWSPLMKEAGLADVEQVDGGEKIRPWFALHRLRHVACSLWIEQGAEPQRVKSWAGHANIQFTFDTYGHLWEDNKSDQAIARAIEKSIAS